MYNYPFLFLSILFKNWAPLIFTRKLPVFYFTPCDELLSPMIIYFSLTFYLTILGLRNSSVIFHVLIGSFPERVSVIAFVSDNLKGEEGQTLFLVSISRAARCSEMLHPERWSHFLRRLKESRLNVLSIYFCCLIYLCFVFILLSFLLLTGSRVRFGTIQR